MGKDLKKINNNDNVSEMAEVESEYTDSGTSFSSDKLDFSGTFDIIKLQEDLVLSIREDGEVCLDEYIKVFQHLFRFFRLLGTVFGFVGSDVKSKIEILDDFRNGSNKDNYETVEKMLNYEKTTDYITENKLTNGSRTLLRLHRSLVFIYMFLEKTLKLAPNDGTGAICKESYNQTLAKYHPWLIQKGAKFAMYALPFKKDLYEKVADGKIASEDLENIIKSVIVSLKAIYDKCEKCYAENNFLDLP